MNTAIQKSKFDVLISSLKETFPKAQREYKKKYYDFNGDAIKLFEWFSKMDGTNVPSDACDEIWHNMILYTQKYSDWCIEYFGKMIHHIPADSKKCDKDCKGCSTGPPCGKCGMCGCYYNR